MKKWPLVSVVAVNFRQPEVTCDMLDSLVACEYPNLEVIVVDNGSLSDETKRWEYHYADVVSIISTENLGFAGGTNLGINASKGELILLLNNDTIVEPDFLFRMVELLEQNPEVGIVSPKIVFAEPYNTIQYAGAFIGQPTLGRGVQIGNMEPDEGQYNDVRMTELPHGACMLVRREVFEVAGLLPEFYFMYFEEYDFTALAAKEGYKVMFCGESKIVHRQSVSIGPGNPRKTYYLHRNRVLYYNRALSKLAFISFLLYYLFVGIPKNMLIHLINRRFDHIYAIYKALRWNIKRLLGFNVGEIKTPTASMQGFANPTLKS